MIRKKPYTHKSKPLLIIQKHCKSMEHQNSEQFNLPNHKTHKINDDVDKAVPLYPTHHNPLSSEHHRHVAPWNMEDAILKVP